MDDLREKGSKRNQVNKWQRGPFTAALAAFPHFSADCSTYILVGRGQALPTWEREGERETWSLQFHLCTCSLDKQTVHQS